MSGGGHIIIRNAIKSALSTPLVHGSLPSSLKTILDPILAKDTADWTTEDDVNAQWAFNWAAHSC